MAHLVLYRNHRAMHYEKGNKLGGDMDSNNSTKAIARGLMGGLLATITMDLACAGLFAGVGMPVDLTYSFIGNIVGNFFLQIGLDVPGSRLLGAVVHFLIGIVLGGLLALAVSRIGALQTDSLKKNLLLGILYIELFSQPILVMAPLFGHLTSSDIINWYVLSCVMHAVFGAVLGIILKFRPKGIVSTDNAL
jgi:hypothetical protein